MDKNNSLLPVLERNLPAGKTLFLKAIGQAAEETGIKAFIVGGAVRDILLGWDPGDLDITVEGDAENFAEKLNRELKGKTVAHGRFKTASIFFGGGSRLDISTAREEKYRRPAELPEVISSSIYSDLYRRDFTVNALAACLNPGEFGDLIDCFGGMTDLQNKTIRVLHEKSFEDDPTRVFRAVRFSLRLGFKIEEKTEALMRKAAAGDLCGGLTGSRLKNEIELLLGEEDPAMAVKMMAEYGLHKSIHPAISITGSTINSLKELGTAVSLAGSCPPLAGFRPWLAYFMGTLPGQDKNTLREISKRLMLSRKESAAVKSLVRLENKAEALNSVEKLPSSEVYSLLKNEPAELIVLINSLIGREKAGITLCKLAGALAVNTEINGRDLLDMGFKPGPGIETALDAVRKAKMDGELSGRKEETDFVLKNFKPGLKEK